MFVCVCVCVCVCSLEAANTTLQDCVDGHIKDTQHCQDSFRQTVQVRLEEARSRTAVFLRSCRYDYLQQLQQDNKGDILSFF